MTSNYELLLKQAEALLEAESDPIANAANLAALIFNGVEDLNWVGFYFFRGEDLVLGPFCGQVACTRIPVGKGVCGTAYASKETQLVADVHLFDGHIACDAASESEVVVPFYAQNLSGVLDIDSPIKNRFDNVEKAFFEQLTQLYSAGL